MAFSSGEAEMNVTPLIDVLLVLIIIFLIIVPVAPTGEEAQIPQENKGQAQTETIRTIVIQVVPNGPGDATLKINGDSITWDDLRPRLFDIFKQRAEKVAFIKADSETEFEPVARVIDIAHAAGVVNIGLMK
ncbi:MAG TPA: biopolymer transporter ExbD [Terriglobales bacterium]|nr:biopolymer transporter ExbD [Terriglobales bacterium]